MFKDRNGIVKSVSLVIDERVGFEVSLSRNHQYDSLLLDLGSSQDQRV